MSTINVCFRLDIIYSISSFVDGTVAVRDVRVGKQHALAFKAQKDVNVISWNRFFCQGMLKTRLYNSVSVS